MKNDKFQEDPSKLSQFLATHFQPSISWEMYTHSIGENNFGIIYVHEARRKPIIACSNFVDQYREGEIFYRYVSETKAIKASDLMGLIESRIESERKEWQDMLAKMATIYPDKALLLNTITGTLDTKGNTFVLAPELLDQIKWVKEGQFKETVALLP